MKIALIAKRVSHTLGGAERVSLYLGKQLSEAGFDVHIITNYSDTPVDGVMLSQLKVKNWFSPWRLLSFQRNVRQVTEGQNFDLVYSLCQVFPVDIYRVGDGIHQYWMQLRYPGSFIRWIKYITSPVHLTMRWLENGIMRKGNCRLFITNSNLIKKQLMDYFGIPEKRIQVIYNGVDHDIFNPDTKSYREAMREKLGIDQRELVLLFVSNNWDRKGLSTIIQSLPKTGISDISLVVAGRGNRKRYVSMAKECNVNPAKLIFAGPADDIEKYYGMSDALVLPSRYEPFANVCLEAMASGIPAVTTRSNGSSEVITDGKDGFVLDTWDDPDNLAHVIQKLSNSASREEMGRNAALAAQKYTWEAHLEQTKKIISSLSRKFNEN
jgi:UDP-glucose:(heptosyl)LPS alpha-1,3-glucosyltransferase